MGECLSPVAVLRPEHAQRIGPVKANHKLLGARSQREDASSPRNGSRFSAPSSDMALMEVGKDMSLLCKIRSSSEIEMARLKSELSDAKKVAEMLRLRVEESKARAGVRKQELEVQKLQHSSRGETGSADYEISGEQCVEPAGELEAARRDLGNLMIDMASVREDKVRAEEEMKSARSMFRSSLKSIERLGKEIQEADEEHVLIELARIEALKESRELETKREVEAARYSQKLQESKDRIVELKKEVSKARMLERTLAATTADVDVLQSEMVFIRAMETKSTYRPSAAMESESSLQLLQSTQAELEAAKRELASIKEGGFKYMASMDILREKMKHVSSESSRLKKIHKEADARVGDLNAELLQVNHDLESASSAKQRREAALSALSAELKNSQADMERARKHREQALKETENLRAEIGTSNSSINSLREALIIAAQGLEQVKSSEATALEKLRNMCEGTARSRAVPPQHGSTITVANFEYIYLKSSAADVHEIARKKVEAARAWVEAFGASEKEMRLQIEWVGRRIEELGEQGSGAEAETIEKFRSSPTEEHSQAAKEQKEADPPRKSVKENRRRSTARRSSLHRRSITLNGQTTSQATSINLHRRSVTLDGQTPSQATSISLRRRRRILPNFAKFLGGRRVAQELGV